MAEVTGGGNARSGGMKTRRKSTRIDMTAMVDVAFLLLTFFVLTAVMNDNRMLNYIMPVDGEPTEVDARKVMSLILLPGDSVAYFIGNEHDKIQYAHNQNELRTAIFGHIKGDGRVLCKENAGLKNCWDPMFLIKSKSDASYQQFVDIMDEMEITKARKYAVGDFTEVDSLALVMK